MKRIKSILLLVVCGILIIVLGACGSSSNSDTSTSEGTSDNSSAEIENSEGNASSEDASQENDTSEESTTSTTEPIVFGTLASMEPMVTPLADLLEERGYTTDINIYDANQLPAEALNNGEIDSVIANHSVWINTFNVENNGTLEMLEPYICYSPLGLYSQNYNSVEEIPENATIAIPGDAANIDRSLYFLQDVGLINLSEKENETDFYDKTDIEENPKNIDILEVEITALAVNFQDADAVINFPSQMLAAEIDAEPLELDPQMMEYALGIIVNSEQEDRNNAWIDDALEIIQTEVYQNRFDETFEGVYYTEW